jgi:hypothetical protein
MPQDDANFRRHPEAILTVQRGVRDPFLTLLRLDRVPDAAPLEIG